MMVKKKILGVVAAVALTVAMTPSYVANASSASHDVPGGGGKQCNNTYFNYVHTGFSKSYSIPSHQLTDGRSCTRTRLAYIHSKICSGCGGVIEANLVFECSEDHSICTNPVPTCE